MTIESSLPAKADETAVSAKKPRLLRRLAAILKGGVLPSTRDDLEHAIAGNDALAGFSQQERSMLKNVLSLRSVRVVDVMVPRIDIVAVPADMTIGSLLKAFNEAAHSRLPVYGETLDDPRGMVHIRDFVDFIWTRATPKQKSGPETDDPRQPDLGAVSMDATLASANILRPVLFVPPSMSALDLLVKMQAGRTHMALVIDEYGGTDGLVSIEDLVEVIVGDIEDEHDVAAGPSVVHEGDNVFVADGRASLDSISAAMGIDLGQGEKAEEIATIGGLVAAMAGRVPVRGEIVPGPGELEFEILEADPRRVSRLRIHPRRGLVELRRRRARSKADPVAPGEDRSPAAPAAGSEKS
jgi:CBS domain containing-hemolysin-like protein